MNASVSSMSTPSSLEQPREAQRLAGSLRVCRLTTLYGASGSGKTALLKDGVLPLLHRRASDVAVPRGLAPRVVIPFPDRRRAPSVYGSGRSAEISLFFDDWGSAPLARMLGQVHEAMSIAAPPTPSMHLSLAGDLAALNMQFGARFLIILDRFEQCVTAATRRADAREFLDELTQALNRPLLPVNFLISVREESRGTLDALRARVPGFDDQSLQLAAPSGQRGPFLRQVPVTPPETPPLPADEAVETALPDADTDIDTDIDAELPVPQTEEDWHRSVDAIVLNAAISARRVHLQGPAIPLDFLSEFAEEQDDEHADEGAPAEADADAVSSVKVDAATPASTEPIAPARVEPELAVPSPSADARDTRSPRLPAWAPARSEAGTDARTDVDVDVEALPPIVPALAAASTLPPPGKSSRGLLLAVLAVAVGIQLGYLTWVRWMPGSEPASATANTTPAAAAPAVVEPPPPVVAPRAAAPVAAPPVASLPPVTAPAAVAESRPPIDLDLTPRPVAELARTLAGTAPPATGAVAWPAGFAPLTGAPGLAVAHYDAMQLARRNGAAAAKAIYTVAPLYTDELYFVARADSAMNFIHDIAAAEINIGPAESGRAVTAAAVYQRLFDKPLQGRAAASWGADAALGQLLVGKGVDVIVLTGAQTAAWFAALPPATAKALKLLKLDRNHPADQRALQAYLPTTLQAGAAAGTPSLAVMSFLVASDAQASDSAAKALCAGLPGLQQSGDAKWREVQAGLQLDAGWPVTPATQQAWRACATRRP